MTQCREGHESTEDDYCSVCGAPMASGGPSAARGPSASSAVSPPAGASSAISGIGACPSCGELRADATARFCEVCRYDFVARKGGPPPAVAPTASARPGALAASTPPPVQAGAQPSVGSGASSWELVVTVDPSLDTDPDPATPCPTGVAELVFLVDAAELLVGRRDDRRDIRPEIPLGDPGTSRRHAKFVKNADGTVSIQDLASMNGTRFNNGDMVPGSRQILAEGDEVTLGRWTRIRIRRKS